MSLYSNFYYYFLRFHWFHFFLKAYFWNFVLECIIVSQCILRRFAELTHLKRPWCWERLRAGGEGNDRGWDSWMTSPTRWTWVWVDSGSWWWTGRPGMLWFMGLERVGHDWVTELNWTKLLLSGFSSKIQLWSWIIANPILHFFSGKMFTYSVTYNFIYYVYNAVLFFQVNATIIMNVR